LAWQKSSATTSAAAWRHKWGDGRP
jgi:hypothetical protein